MNDWAVYRLDFNANEFLVQKGLSKDEAARLAEEYLAKGHHQHYWFDKQPSEDTDFVGQLSNMLSSGSSHELAIKVLLGQGATAEGCYQALESVTELTADECRSKVQQAACEFGENVE